MQTISTSQSINRGGAYRVILPFSLKEIVRFCTNYYCIVLTYSMLHVYASDDVLSYMVIKLYNKKPVFGKTGSKVRGRIPSTVWIIKCHTPTLTTSLKRDKTDAKMAKFKVLSKVMRMYSYSGTPRSLLTVALAIISKTNKAIIDYTLPMLCTAVTPFLPTGDVAYHQHAGGGPAVDISNMHNKFGKDRVSGSKDILTDRQTHRHIHQNTLQTLPRVN